MIRNSGALNGRLLACCLPFFLILFSFIIACGGRSSSSMTATMTAVPRADHVVLVVLENHSFQQVIGSASMPYLNSLAQQHGLAANYFANTHPSIGNYFMLTAGAVETNDDSFSGAVSDDNIVRALNASGKSWKAYIESLPSPAYTGASITPTYEKSHNPFSYLSDVLNSTAQAGNMVPFTQLSSDLSSGTLPNFVYIAPNPENDAHDCPGAAPSCNDTDKLAAADAWLQSNIDPLIHSPAFGNGLLIITWDESTDSDMANGGGQVATVLVGSRVKPGFQSTMMHQHQDTLRTILQALGVSDFPNAAANANGMGEMFQ